jgi:hypothetical protein
MGDIGHVVFKVKVDGTEIDIYCPVEDTISPYPGGITCKVAGGKKKRRVGREEREMLTPRADGGKGEGRRRWHGHRKRKEGRP